MKYIRAIRLFLKIIFSQIEPKSCGIPDPYRIKGRMGIWLSLHVVYIVCIKRWDNA